MFKQSVLLLGLMLLCTACAVTPPAINILSDDFEPYTVVLAPNTERGILEVVSAPQGWEKAGKQNGWVGFERGKNGIITFTLDALPSKPVCTNDPATTAEWVISKIELTKTGNPQTQKGSNFGKPQTGWIKDAFPQMDSENGEIKGTGIGSISVAVLNLNNNNGRKDGYYQVTATSCNPALLPLVTDPGFGNGGRR